MACQPRAMPGGNKTLCVGPASRPGAEDAGPSRLWSVGKTRSQVRIVCRKESTEEESLSVCSESCEEVSFISPIL